MVTAPSSWPLNAIKRMPHAATMLKPITAASVFVQRSSPGAPCLHASTATVGRRSSSVVTTKFVSAGESEYWLTVQSVNSRRIQLPAK